MKKVYLLIGLVLLTNIHIQAQELKSKLVNDKYGFFDSKDSEIIKPEYDEVREFSENLAAVKINTRWGYINKQGVIVIPFTYHMALDFIEGKAPVKEWGKWGIINKDNRIIKPFEYDDVARLSYGEYILTQGEIKYYFDRYGFSLEKARIQAIEKAIREAEVAKAGVTRETILGNMVIEKKIDRSGTILFIDDKTTNIKFSSYNDIYKSLVYTFDIDGKKNIYFKSANKAIKSSFILPTYEKKYFVTMPTIPWDGETNPAPEILMKIEDRLTIVNLLNGKKIVLPFELDYEGKMVYNDQSYPVCSFTSHANINFCTSVVYCKACNGEGLTKGKDYYETKTTTTYSIVKEYRERHTTGYDVVTRKVPVTKTEKILKKGKLESCKICNSSGIIEKAKYIRWNGEKIEELGK